MKRSYSDLDQLTGDPPFAFGPTARGPRQPKQYQQQTEPGTGKIKACMQCGTTRTPQWREGPYGPKTLCNACGVKRVRAIKAQQQGKNPQQVPHPTPGTSKKKTAASAAARTQESIELATTLQLLAGNMEVGPPPAKRQARAGQLGGGGRGRKAHSMQAAANHVPEYDPFDPAAAAAMSAPALGSAVQKAIAAIAAKGSMGGESNPTDSGEEISWSPNDHTAPGDAAAAAAGEGAGGRRQRQQQQQLRAAMAAVAQLQAAGEAEDLMQLAGLQDQQLTEAQQQQMEGSLAESYGAAAADAGHDGAGAVDEEAAAVANLLSMSAATGDQQNGGAGPTSTAGKAAMREFVAQLAAGSSTPSNTAASRSPARRQSARTSPQRHSVSARQRSAAAAAAAAAGAEGLVEDDVLFLLGPGMGVMARYVAPEELLEVIKLNELASEAQRSKAAAEAAVEAVEQILRDKQTAAAAAQAAARSAMQRLHSFVGELNAEHSLMLKAAQEQQPASLVSRLASSSAVVSSLTQLDILAASLQQQQQQQMQELQQEPMAEHARQQQYQSMEQPEQEDSLAGLAAAAVAAAAAAGQAGVLAGVVKAEVYDEGAEGVGAGQLVVEPLVVGEGVGAGAVDARVDAADAMDAADVDAAAAAVDAAGLAVADAEPYEALAQQHGAGFVSAQPELAQSHELQLLQHAAAEALAAQLAEAAEADDQMPLADDDVDLQDAQLLGSLQELAAIAGMGDYADNNGAAAVAGSPAML